MSHRHSEKQKEEEENHSGSNVNSNSNGNGAVTFRDLLPLMLEKLGPDEFMEELSKGFRLLMDPISSNITQQSLLRNAKMLGLGDMSEEDAAAMLREGDSDGDGALDLHEFLVLMLRLSPEIMDRAAESINLTSSVSIWD